MQTLTEQEIIEGITSKYDAQTITPTLRLKISQEIQAATGRNLLVEIVGNRIRTVPNANNIPGDKLLFG